MRSVLFSALAGLAILAALTPVAQASWLSEAWHHHHGDRDWSPRYYIPPNISGYGSYPGTYGGYYVPPYYQAPPTNVPMTVPNISGTWYMWGDGDKPCQIIQRQLDGRALFINEHCSRAWGTVQGNQVWIPDWNSSVSQGLWGTIQGDRIVWPDGSYWSR
jgi:hypothetical protein